jgi:outer membrane protein assembly factor BamE (lipoprotein component of BamABCDE complex)
MRKRVVLILVVLAIALLGGYLLLWATAPTDSITADNAAKIYEGMTEPDVEQVLGGPAGVYHPDGETWAWVLENGRITIGHRRKIWVGRAGGIRVHFDEGGRVAVSQWVDGPERSLDLLAKLRRWLGIR